MIETPTIVQVTAQQTAVIHIVVPRAQMSAAVGPALTELAEVLAAQAISATGPLFAHHLKMSPTTFDFDMGFPVNRPVEPTGNVKPASLPAGTIARSFFTGDYSGLHDAWHDFGQWLEANGHRAADTLWETYLTDPEKSPDPKTWRTELNQPLIG